MSLVMSIVTTTNRTLRFTQSDPARVEEVLASLRRVTQLFTSRSLIVVGDHSTEVLSPHSITRLEIATARDLESYLPPAWAFELRALTADEATAASRIDELSIASRVDCFFAGGDTLAAWVETKRPVSHGERSQRVATLFEQPVIPYRPSAGGIGLINPATLIRLRFATAIYDPPAGAWHLQEA